MRLPVSRGKTDLGVRPNILVPIVRDGLEQRACDIYIFRIPYIGFDE